MAAQPEMPAVARSIKSWDEAVQAVRGRTAWFVTALAVIAVALFGATAIVVRPELSWKEDALRLAAAGIVGTIGVVLAVAIAYQASKTYMPVVVSLYDPPEALKKDLEQHPEGYLPPGSTSASYTGDAISARKIAQLRRDDLSAARLALARDPSNVALQKTVGVQELILSGAAAREQQFADAYRAILERARFEKVSDQRKLKTWVPVAGALVAALGVWYQLILATPKEADSTDSSSAGAVIAVLSRDETNPANTQLWATLGLDACQPVGPVVPTGILVAVTSGKGTSESPYTVTTLPATAKSSGCPALSFSTIDTVAPVVITKPTEIDITYVPGDSSPSPTS